MNSGDGVRLEMHSGEGDRDESVDTPDELDDAEQVNAGDAINLVGSTGGDIDTLLKTDEIEGRLYGENR